MFLRIDMSDDEQSLISGKLPFNQFIFDIILQSRPDMVGVWFLDKANNDG